MGEPFFPTRASCGGQGGRGHCGTAPTWDGFAYFPHSRNLYRSFACDDHLDCLAVARPLDASSRSEMERRRERDRLVIDEKQPVRKDPPFATGRDALARLAAARSYAKQHPEDGWWVHPESRGW